MNIIKDYIPQGRDNRPGYKMKPEYICVHDTANLNATALAHAVYLSKNSIAERLPVSWHVTVDDINIIQHLPFNESGWHAGDGASGPGNRKSIGVEICEFTDEGKRHKAEENAMRVVACLANEFSIPAECVVQHHHWADKNCPRVLRSRPGGWAGFIGMVKKYRQVFTDVPDRHWAAVAIRYCKENNLMIGDTEGRFRPDEPVTRAELAIVAATLHKKC